MFLEQPLPSAGEAGAEVRSVPRAPRARVAASDLGTADFPLIVPQFFGGVLPLADGVEVRVLDASFEEPRHASDRPENKHAGTASKAGAARSARRRGREDSAQRGAAAAARATAAAAAARATAVEEERALKAAAAPSNAATVLTRVRVTLVDAKGRSVGDPIWCNVQEFLAALHAPACVTPEVIPTEEGVRAVHVDVHVYVHVCMCMCIHMHRGDSDRGGGASRACACACACVHVCMCACVLVHTHAPR